VGRTFRRRKGEKGKAGVPGHRRRKGERRRRGRRTSGGDLDKSAYGEHFYGHARCTCRQSKKNARDQPTGKAPNKERRRTVVGPDGNYDWKKRGTLGGKKRPSHHLPKKGHRRKSGLGEKTADREGGW